MAETDRPVYVLRAELGQPNDEGYDPAALWASILRGKRLVAVFVLVFVTVGVAYSLLAQPWYQADVTLAPVEKS